MFLIICIWILLFWIIAWMTTTSLDLLEKLLATEHPILHKVAECVVATPLVLFTVAPIIISIRG
jgi:hypothetical protein